MDISVNSSMKPFEIFNIYSPDLDGGKRASNADLGPTFCYMKYRNFHLKK